MIVLLYWTVLTQTGEAYASLFNILSAPPTALQGSPREPIAQPTRSPKRQRPGNKSQSQYSSVNSLLKIRHSSDFAARTTQLQVQKIRSHPTSPNFLHPQTTNFQLRIFPTKLYNLSYIVLWWVISFRISWLYLLLHYPNPKIPVPWVLRLRFWGLLSVAFGQIWPKRAVFNTKLHNDLR